MNTAAPLRRRPTQRRSARRVELMLDACADLLAEVGYEALSTTRIAERAGVAIGSVYQFFPDKRAIAQALTLRNLEMFMDRVSRRFAELTFDHWGDAVDAAIDEYVSMHRTVKSFRILHFGDVVDTHLLESGADNNAVISKRLYEVLLDAFDLPGSPELSRAVAVAIDACDGVLKYAFRLEPDGDPDIVIEAKRLVRAYLQGYIPT